MAARLKVMFVIGSMGGGGAERQILHYLRHLDRDRFEPQLYLAHRQGELLPEVPGDVRITAFWEQFPRWLARLCWVTGTTRVLRWRHLARTLRREQIDAVYDRTFLATLDAGPATWWRKTPRISAVVADPKVQMDLYFPRRQWLWKRFAQRVYRTADVVLANSAGLRDQVVNYFALSPERVRIRENVIDVSRIDQLAANSQACDDADRLRFRILTVGRIDQHKGHRDLLAALQILVREHNQAQLVWEILGDGPERTPLLAEVERLGLQTQVRWRGMVPNPYPYYRAADLFCLPSLSEGSPNVLIEALALGTPVISTDCPSGPREILENGRWGTLVPVQNPTALAAAIRDYLEHRQEWLDRAQAAQPVIRSRYDSATGVRQLETLLLEVAARPK